MENGKPLIVLSIDTLKRSVDETYPLIIEVMHYDKKRRLDTYYQVSEKEFVRLVKSVLLYTQKGDVHDAMLRYLLDEIIAIQYAITFLNSYVTDFTVADILKLYRLNQKPFLFIPYLKGIIQEYKKEGRKAKARLCSSLLQQTIAFHHSKRPLYFIQMDKKWLEAFRKYLLKLEISTQMIDSYWLILQEIYANASSEGLCAKFINPFKENAFPTLSELKCEFTISDIDNLFGLDLSENPELAMARDICLFKHFADDMTFMDMIFIKRDDVYQDNIWFRRNKDNRLCLVDNNETLKRIIDKFTFTGVYLFPLPFERKQEYGNYFFKELRWYNGELKKIAKLLNVPIKKVPCL
ncbi:phage integrase SAM-like domain-containing protein [uncultured Bacteroides sp.]|uniref:phage integrase SAM-like domain-containing protein n=1 Tax=uncultured Bacteroides sp. TaxID=162156 RepID=UPI002AAC169A|nr:phage integrase SAM-like domain-containing protein [uncultured Bacteroides sp.]